MPKTEIERTLAQRLRAWRAGKRYTQTDAARELSTNFRTYQDWERDVAHPTGFGLACLLRMLATFESSNPNEPKQ